MHFYYHKLCCLKYQADLAQAKATGSQKEKGVTRNHFTSSIPAFLPSSLHLPLLPEAQSYSNADSSNHSSLLALLSLPTLTRTDRPQSPPSLLLLHARRPRRHPLQRLLLLHSRHILDLLPPRHAGQPIKKQGRGDIKSDKRPHNAEIPPTSRILRAELREIGIRRRSGAKAAVGRSVGVGEIAARLGDVRGHVLCAGFVGGGLEGDEFDVGADDVVVGEPCGKHAVDEVGEGGDAVHEDPEAREGGGAGEDAAEDEGEGEEQVADVTRGFGVFDAGDDHVGEGGGEEQEGPDEEEHQGAALVDLVGGDRVAVHADGVVEGEEDDDGHEGVPGEFDDDVGEHEDLPRVGFRGAFAGLVEGALGDEVGEDLLHELPEDGHEHEDGEELVLEPLQGDGGVPEGEADEEAGDGAEHGFGVEVGGCAPVLGENSPGDFAELHHERFGEFEKCGWVVVDGSALKFSLHVGESFSNLNLFERVAPFIRPVDGVCGTRGSPDNVQHPFSRIFLSATFP